MRALTSDPKSCFLSSSFLTVPPLSVSPTNFPVLVYSKRYIAHSAQSHTDINHPINLQSKSIRGDVSSMHREPIHDHQYYYGGSNILHLTSYMDDWYGTTHTHRVASYISLAWMIDMIQQKVTCKQDLLRTWHIDYRAVVGS